MPPSRVLFFYHKGMKMVAIIIAVVAWIGLVIALLVPPAHPADVAFFAIGERG